MDDELRKAERAWRASRDDDTAQAFLASLTRSGDLLLQLMRRLCHESLGETAEPSWDRVVAWWLRERPPIPPAPESPRRRRRNEQPLLTGSAVTGPALPALPSQLRPIATGGPDASAPNNRGYGWHFLVAMCRCGHYRGDHAGSDVRAACGTCRCLAFTPRLHSACTQGGCERTPAPGYPMCLQHAAQAMARQNV